MAADPSVHLARADIVSALADFPVREANVPDARAAAVCIAVGTDAAGDTAFLLTMRPARMREHAGQFALPGGRVDPGETSVEAALRELREEVGIDAADTDVLGRLDDYPTRSGYVISPFVVWIADRVTDAVPNPAEVAELFAPTMAELDVDPRFVRIPQSDRPVVQWPFRRHLVHAPTGAIVHQFREVVLHGRHTRVDTLEQPVFAWK